MYRILALLIFISGSMNAMETTSSAVAAAAVPQTEDRVPSLGKLALRAVLKYPQEYLEAFLADAREDEKGEYVSGVSEKMLTDQHLADIDADYTKSLAALQKRAVKVLEGHGDLGPVAAFSDNGHFVLTFADDHVVRLFDAQSGQIMSTFTAPQMQARAGDYAECGNRFVSAFHVENTVQIKDARSMMPLRELKGHTGLIRSVAFSHNGKWVLTGSNDKTARLWDADSGEAIEVLDGHADWVKSVAFSPDDKQVVTGSWDKTVRIWDLGVRRKIEKLKKFSRKEVRDLLLCKAIADLKGGDRITSSRIKKYVRKLPEEVRNPLLEYVSDEMAADPSADAE